MNKPLYRIINLPFRRSGTNCHISNTGRRYLSSYSSQTHHGTRIKPFRILPISFCVALTVSACALLRDPVHADANDSHSTDNSQRKPTSLSSLFRSYIVYSMCSIPTLVDWSPTILSFTLSIPGLRQVTESIVRATFFGQFVGGDTAEDAQPLLEALRAENKGVLFAYSVEVDEIEAAGKDTPKGESTNSTDIMDPVDDKPIHKRIVDEMLHCINVAANFEDQKRIEAGYSVDRAIGRRTWVAVKLTALLPSASSLVSLSRHLLLTRPPLPPTTPHIHFPGAPFPSDLDILDVNDPSQLPKDSPLTMEDIVSLRELRNDLFRICNQAKRCGVKIIVDAEYSWYQPAIEAYQLALMREFNSLPSTPRLTLLSRVSNMLFWFTSQPSTPSVVVQPLVYGTYQAYLRRTPEYLKYALTDAHEYNYALGVKLVRGAYHTHEIAAHAEATSLADASTRSSGELITKSKSSLSTNGNAASLSISPERLPPVWLQKAETDVCYDACAALLVSALATELKEVHGTDKGESIKAPPRLALLFGTHNWASAGYILKALEAYELAERIDIHSSFRNEPGWGVDDGAIRVTDDVAERVALAQLYGMSDALTDALVERTRCSFPFVIKYVPYGALSEVMPYLSRRAIENKSVLGGGAAIEERKRAGSEILRRIFPVFF